MIFEDFLKEYSSVLEKSKNNGANFSAIGKTVADVFLSVLCRDVFETFKKDLENNDYENVYSSVVFTNIGILCKKENLSTLKKGQSIFRARIIGSEDLNQGQKGIDNKDGKLSGYNWVNSKEPPIGFSPEGRANIKNSSYFYCAVDEITALSEVKSTTGDYISLAEFKCNRNLKLIDLSNKAFDKENLFEIVYMDMLTSCFSVPVNDLKKYRLTQFISDEIRKFGIDGICYKSQFTDSYNYVIFNCSMQNLKFKESRIIRLHSQQLAFIDFSNSKLIKTDSIKDPLEMHIQKEKEQISDIIEKSRLTFVNNTEDTKND